SPAERSPGTVVEDERPHAASVNASADIAIHRCTILCMRPPRGIRRSLSLWPILERGAAAVDASGSWPAHAGWKKCLRIFTRSCGPS
ncbi:MAG TPA: hypothetical protein VFM56_03155, partial [Solimonas sp.]|nr:hypothetical protein [Solimonas sp.]